MTWDAVRDWLFERIYLAWRRIEAPREGTPSEWGFTFCGIHWLYMNEIVLIPKSPGAAERMFAVKTDGCEQSGPICDRCAERLMEVMHRDLVGNGWVATPHGLKRAES